MNPQRYFFRALPSFFEALAGSAPSLLKTWRKPLACSAFGVEDTPNVVFPCAALTDAPTGCIAICYGASDTVTCLAYARADEVVEYVKANSKI